ncbi:VC0807 family protein [Pseudonocardia sp. ICBG1293]|uniref:VC0807 family protein n=1 Tax=Pseudonocardia sp. ICBG1293 TaxID=2844382 RepID=UPI00272E32EE|nr:VC0807 family protein [Pseudonocardia sp. ICBG1293]
MTTTTTPTDGPPAAATGRGAVLRQTVGSLLVDAALPYLVYVVLTGQGMSDVAALAWSALPPALSVALQAARHRRLNPVGAIVLVTIAAGLATSLLSGDARFAVARDAIQSIAFALLLTGPLVVGRRPLVFGVCRFFGSAQRPDLPEIMERQWAANPVFRRTMRRATGIAALVMVLEAALRITLAYSLAPVVALPILSVQSIVVWTAMSALLVVSVRRAARAGR